MMLAIFLVTALRATMEGSKSKQPETGALKKYLYGLINHQGLSGTLTMDSDGAVRSIRERIYRYNNGKLTKELDGQ